MRVFLVISFGVILYGLGLHGFSLTSKKPSVPAPEKIQKLALAEFLRGSLYLEKSHRLVIYWKNKMFELWDTEHGIRVIPITQLPRPVGWCVISPDEETIVTADRIPNFGDKEALEYHPNDRMDRGNGLFVPTVSVWDAKSGRQKHLIQVPEAKEHPFYTYEWYPQWLNKSSLLIVRLLRQNPARCASKLKLIVVDVNAGKIVKSSEDFEWVGEHLMLSPDRKMALVMDDNYVRRNKGQEGLKGVTSNAYARTTVFDLERLALISSWREPPDETGEFRIALEGRWCPDGKAVLTVGKNVYDGRLSPRVRLWDAHKGRLLKTFAGHSDYILDVGFTSNGDKLLTGSEDRTIRLWNIGTGKCEAIFSGHSAGLNRIVVLPGDKLAVSAAEEPVAKVWNLAGRKLKFNLPGHDSAVREVEVVSGTVVRTITLFGTTTIWDCSTGERLQTIPKLPFYPKRFGNCELIEKEGTFFMRTLKKKRNLPARCSGPILQTPRQKAMQT